MQLSIGGVQSNHIRMIAAGTEAWVAVGLSSNHE